jgi:hypothetical protein
MVVRHSLPWRLTSKVLDHPRLYATSSFGTLRVFRTTKVKAGHRLDTQSFRRTTSTAIGKVMPLARRTKELCQMRLRCHPCRQTSQCLTRFHTLAPHRKLLPPVDSKVPTAIDHLPALAILTTVVATYHPSTTSVARFLQRSKAVSHSDHYAKPTWTPCLAVIVFCRLVTDADVCGWIASRI